MDKFKLKASKRKKRRTRRNLDEIRKRTLQVYGNIYNETICNPVNPKVISCITNSRLTLANKAIQSETVTRPPLLNLGKENNRNQIVFPNREQANDTIVTKVNYNKNTIPFNVNSKIKITLPNFTEVKDHTTPDSIILLCSSESETMKTINNITINDVLSESPISPDLSFVMHSDNSLYSEFMTDIVNYVQEFASIFFKTDIVFKANFLQNVICSNNKNILNLQTHMNKDVAKTKLTITGNDETISPKSHNDINKQYSLEQSRKVRSPVRSPVLQQCYENDYLQKCKSSSPTTCSGKDSPEYFYYPHRLNH